jgi:YVTN family beta-propeller protein
VLIRHRAPICATVLLAAVFWASVCASRPSGTTALLRLVSPRQANLRRLWVANDESNTLTPIDPATGHVGRPVPVADPYNLYFTPNGRRAIVVTERLGRLDFREPQSMRLRHALAVPCPASTTSTSPPTAATCWPVASSGPA